MVGKEGGVVLFVLVNRTVARYRFRTGLQPGKGLE